MTRSSVHVLHPPRDKGGDAPASRALEIRKVGVVGAGQMGSGITQVCAQSGYEVCLVDVNEEVLAKSLAGIRNRMERQVERKRMSKEDFERAIASIKTATDYKAFADCDLVIEAATENEKVKREIFQRLIQVVALHEPGAGDGAGRADPRHRHRRRHLRVGQSAGGQARQDAGELRGFPGVHRQPHPDAEAMRLGTHHPMGPLELADFIGLDTCLSIMQVLYEGLADSKYRPCPLLVKYVDAGWLGRKTGRGFYDYAGEKPVPTR
jgi:3-hydroxybutyryl-CoA dehydrogenase